MRSHPYRRSAVTHGSDSHTKSYQSPDIIGYDTGVGADCSEALTEWKDDMTARSLLEQRYPVDDVVLGSPLFRECYSGIDSIKVGSGFLSMYLWSIETSHAVRQEQGVSCLYPTEEIGTIVPGTQIKRRVRSSGAQKRRTRSETEKLQDKQASVGRLPAGIAKRTHRKPGAFCCVQSVN